MNKTKDLFEDDYDVPDDDEERLYGKKLVKKCHCGHKGPLIPDLAGHCCENCGYLLVDKPPPRKKRRRAPST